MKWFMGYLRKIRQIAMDTNLNDQKHSEFTQSSDLKIPASIGPRDFDPDHPISSDYKEDRLGFRSVAKLLASSLLTHATSHGLVVSVEGEWGSGKSSLVNLMADELKNNQRQGGSKFEVLIDRLYSLDEAALPADAVPPILMVLANCMDEVGLKDGKGEWGVRWSWNAGKKLFGKLIARLAEGERSKVINEIFTSGAAIGWLMAELIRGEVFAHGRIGNERKPEENRIFSERELDEATTLLLNRFESEDREKIIDTPEVLNLMYGWLQSGDEAGVMEWVREQHATNAGLLKLLAACRGWMHSDRTYYPLNRRDLKIFMNFDEALERLNDISENPDVTEDERALAAELIRAAEIGKDN